MSLAIGIPFLVFVAVFPFVLQQLIIRRSRTPDILTERQRRKVVLTLKTGEGFLGILESHDARAVVLRNASALGIGEQGSDQSVDGELLVLREDVGYIQVL